MQAEPRIIPLLSPADIQSAGADLDSINTAKLQGTVRIGILIGAVTGDNPIVLCYAGATAGTKTTEIAFRHRKASADTGSASADVLGSRTEQAVDGVGLALGVAATADLRLYVIEVDVDDMPESKPWLTVFLDDGSASVLLAAAFAVADARYGGDADLTAL